MDASWEFLFESGVQILRLQTILIISCIHGKESVNITIPLN